MPAFIGCLNLKNDFKIILQAEEALVIILVLNK